MARASALRRLVYILLLLLALPLLTLAQRPTPTGSDPTPRLGATPIPH
jgi:hypothetical protein